MTRLAVWSLMGCAALCALVFSPVAHASETLLTIELLPGGEECFYEDIKKGQTVDLDWEIISGAANDKDVDALFWDANDREIEMPESVTNYFEHKSPSDGSIRVCFRNLQSFKNLWVYFELTVDKEYDNDDDFAEVGEADQHKEAQKEIVQKFERIKKMSLNIHQKLTSTIRTQNYLRYREARHRNTQESNNDRIFTWSLMTCLVMVACSLVQVYAVRNFFAAPDKSHGRFDY
eukprot:CFRG6084T1